MVGTQQLLRWLPNEITISFLGKEITPVSNAKDLGIILDNNLTYDQHIHQTSRSFKLFRISRAESSQKKKIEHITPALREIKWLLVNEHLHYRNTVMTFRCVKGLAPTYLCESLRRRKSIHHHNTRNSESLDIPQSKTKSGQRCFLHRAVNIWNNLDKDFTQLSLTSFKKSWKRTFQRIISIDRFL